MHATKPTYTMHKVTVPRYARREQTAMDSKRPAAHFFCVGGDVEVEIRASGAVSIFTRPLIIRYPKLQIKSR